MAVVDWDCGKKYSVIYADPPWDWKTHSIKGAKKSPTSKYSCMTLDDILKLDVPKLTAEDCILFCWCTAPLLDKQIDVMKGWGFVYKSVGFTWVKQNKSGIGFFMGLGYYTRANPEFCLIGRKGFPQRPKNRSVRQLVVSPLREHSRKPDTIRGYIESMYDGPYLELFARTEYPGWDCIGNEVGKFSSPTSLFEKEEI